MSVIFIDLDRFKLINDTLGHAGGDSLLKGVCERAVSCLRRGETAARLGGDEFAVLIEEAEDELAAAHVADRIATALRQPFAFGEREVFATASIGIAAGTVEEPGTLLRKRGRGDVPRQGARQGPLRDIRAGDARRGDGPPSARIGATSRRRA